MYGRREGSRSQTEVVGRSTSGYSARTGSPSRSLMSVISGTTSKSGRAAGRRMYL